MPLFIVVRGRGILRSSPAQSPRKQQLCLATPHVGKDTLLIHNAGRRAPHDSRPAFFVVLAARVAFCSSKDTSSGVCTLLQPRLHRNGANGFLTETKRVLGAKPFVVEAMLWTTVAVSAVFVMYVLVRRWL